MLELRCQLEELLSELFIDDEGEAYQIRLLPALSVAEVAKLASQMPTGTLPQEIKELLLYSRGMEFGWLQDVRFNAFGEFGIPGLFPACIELMHDGAGNYWVLDINEAGQWGAVFYICHDPPVIIRQAASLVDFLRQLQEYGRFKSASWFGEVYERLVIKTWKERKIHPGLFATTIAVASDDTTLSLFAARQPPGFLLADLRASSLIQGFAYNKLFRHGREQVSKHELEPMWAFEPPKQSWFSRLLGLTYNPSLPPPPSINH